MSNEILLKLTISKLIQLLKCLKSFMKTVSSRQYLGRKLSKMPSCFFPKYRLIISSSVVNQKTKSLISKSYESESSETEADKKKTKRCCKYCHHYQLDFSDQISIKSEGYQTVPSPPPLPDMTDFSKTKHSTPSRRLTIHDLKSVKLKHIENLPKIPNSDDLLHILRKRFSAMHSPSKQSFLTQNSETDFE